MGEPPSSPGTLCVLTWKVVELASYVSRRSVGISGPELTDVQFVDLPGASLELSWYSVDNIIYSTSGIIQNASPAGTYLLVPYWTTAVIYASLPARSDPFS